MNTQLKKLTMNNDSSIISNVKLIKNVLIIIIINSMGKYIQSFSNKKYVKLIYDIFIYNLVNKINFTLFKLEK